MCTAARVVLGLSTCVTDDSITLGFTGCAAAPRRAALRRAAPRRTEPRYDSLSQTALTAPPSAVPRRVVKCR